MPSWTYDLTVLILFHLKAFELILFRFLLFFFLISRIFQILLNVVVDTVITVIIIAAISSICIYDLRICFICIIISIHERYICLHIICICTDIDMPDIFAAYSHLHIISRFEYNGIVIIIIFHMHKCCIWICLRETVALCKYIYMKHIFIHLQRIFL